MVLALLPIGVCGLQHFVAGTQPGMVGIVAGVRRVLAMEGVLYSGMDLFLTIYPPRFVRRFEQHAT